MTRNSEKTSACLFETDVSALPTCDEDRLLWSVFGNNPFFNQISKWNSEIPNTDAAVWLRSDVGNVIPGTVSSSLSFSALRSNVQKLGSYLQNELKLDVGSRIILCYQPGLDFISAFFACISSGIIAVPVYPPDSAKVNVDLPRFFDIIMNAGAKYVLTTTHYRRTFYVMSTLQWHKGWKQIEWVQTNQVINEDQVGCFRPPRLHPNHVAFLQFTSGSTGKPNGVMVTQGSLLHNCIICLKAISFQSSLEDPSTNISLNCDIKSLFITLEQRQKVSQRVMGHRMRALNWLPFYYDMGLIGFIAAPYIIGITVYSLSPFDFIRNPHVWLEFMSRLQCIATAAPNFAYDLVTRKMPSEVYDRLDLSKVCTFLCGGEPIRASTINKFMKLFGPKGVRPSSFLPAYGLAEHTLIVSVRERWNEKFTILTVEYGKFQKEGIVESVDISDDMIEKSNGKYKSLVDCGTPCDGVEVRIVDDANLVEVPHSHGGEVWVSSASSTKGYFKFQGESERFFGAECTLLSGGKSGPRFLRTGDKGFLHNGKLYIAGRIKDMLIIRGRNCYPQDIEEAAEKCASVRIGSTACFGLEVNGEEKLAMAVELREFVLEKSGIRNWVSGLKRKKDPSYLYKKCVSEIFTLVVVNSGFQIDKIWLLKPRTLPKTSSDKVCRSTTRCQLLDQTQRGIIYCYEVGETEPESTSTYMEFSGRTTAITPTQRSMVVATTSPRLSERSQAKDGLRNEVCLHVEESAQSVLGMKVSVDSNTPLHELGIDSLVAVLFSAEISNRLDIIVHPTTIFKYPTVKDMVDFLVDEVENRREMQFANSEMASTSPENVLPLIGVLGVSCRFPGLCDSPAVFWNSLLDRIDGIVEVPRRRWNIEEFYDPDPEQEGKMYIREAGFIRNVHLYDAGFFRTPRAEAFSMDPQQRLLLEVSYEALKDAGFSKETLKNASCGVFVGCCSCDWINVHSQGQKRISAFSATCKAFSLLANRVSYTLGIKGPSMTIDTACASSLTAIHIAMTEIRAGSCVAAVASGINIILHPDLSILLCKAQMMAPDARCKTFDAKANGYVRGEGVASLIIGKVREYKNVVAYIRGSAVNHSGAAASLTAPNPVAQQEVIRNAILNAGIKSDDVMFVETHGTGTKLGDPIEVQALKGVFGPGRDESNSLILGAVKTNIGHLEGAAGIAGVIKAIFVAKHLVVPPNLHFTKLNPFIDTTGFSFVLPQTAISIKPDNQIHNYIGISAFGFGGSNAHLIINSLLTHTITNEIGAKAQMQWNHADFSWETLTSAFIGRKRILHDGITQYDTSLSRDLQELFLDHVIAGRALMPGAAFIEMTLAVGNSFATPTSSAYQVEDMEILNPLVIPQDPRSLQLSLNATSGQDVRILSIVGGHETQEHARARVSVVALNSLKESVIDVKSLRVRIKDMMDIEKFYQQLKENGLEYRSRFQTIREMYRSDNEVLAKLESREPLSESEEAFIFHPATLDGAFQSAAALVMEKSVDKAVFVPMSLSRGIFMRVAPNAELWSHLTLLSASYEVVRISLEVMETSGNVVARVDELTLRRFSFEKGSHVDIPRRLLWEVEWRQQTEVLGSDVWLTNESDNGGLVSLLLGVPALHQLEVREVFGERHEYYSADDLSTSSAMEGILGEERWEVILYLSGIWEDVCPMQCLTGATILLQGIYLRLKALGSSAKIAPVWFVTSGSQSIVPGEWLPRVPRHAGLIGLVRSARLELEGAVGECVHVGMVDLDPGCEILVLNSLHGQLQSATAVKPSSSFETEVAIRGGQQYVSRLIKSTVICRGALELHMSERGSLSNLTLRPLAESSRISPASDECELRIRAVGLNFRDVLNVMGLYPGDPGPPGADCSGTIVSVGSEVSDLNIGDAVYGIVPGCLRTYATTKAALVSWMPESLSFEQAGALPTVLSTVLYGLGDLASVKSGDRVLIHALSGGVGLTALQYCLGLGAVVYGTAGNEKKREYVKSLGATYVSSSRDASVFLSEMASTLGEEKMDVVLNCLTDDFIPASLELMREDGWFIEIGKRGIWSIENVQKHKPSIHYKPIALDHMLADDPLWFSGMLTRGVAHICDGRVQGLPLHVFNIDESSVGNIGGVEALRFLQRAQHIGKVVVRIPSAMAIRSESESVRDEMNRTYVISGGLGGLGLVVAKWMVEEGARHIVLLSRRGVVSAEMENDVTWQWLTGPCSGALIRPMKCDVSEKSCVLRVLQEIESSGEMPPVRGIFHAAGVLADAALLHQNAEKVQSVYLPKAVGAWNLHEASEELGLNEKLEVFMMFSSTAGVLGNFGQANYSAANCCLDALVAYRRSKGLCGQSIQWGPWIDQGMAMDIRDKLDRVGIVGITNDLGLRVLGDVMRHAQQISTVCCQPLHWSLFMRRYESSPLLLSEVAQTASTGASDNSSSLAEHFTGMSSEEQFDFVQKTVVESARRVLGSNDDIPLDSPLVEAGIDSLGAVEFRNDLQDKIGIKLPATALFDYPTLNAIIGYVCKQLKPSFGSAEPAPVMSSVKLSSVSKLGIVGISCRLPGSSNCPDSLWKMLCDGVDCISEIPLSRFNVDAVYDSDPDAKGKIYVREGAFIDGADLFDNNFFKIPMAEAVSMDPQQRIMLEVSHEAFCSGGFNGTSLVGMKLGVYLACCLHEWLTRSDVADNSYSGTGAATSLVANRISYVYGLTGPSMAIDTACSSSLVALDAAVASIETSGSSSALVGGVQVYVAPHSFIAFCRSRMLSTDARCKTFDELANGYVRGEGCGAVILQPVEDARSTGRKVYAVVRGTATNHDGRSASLTAPNGPAQQLVLKCALQRAHIDPSEVRFLETHGTGTALGDPIEMGAILAVYGHGRSEDNPLVLGAIKTNFGHTEGTAGMAGLIKLIQCLRYGTAVPNLHLRSLNPHIEVEGFPVIFPSKSMDLMTGVSGRSLIGSVSSFGFGGANAHAIVERADDPVEPAQEESTKNAVASSGVVFMFTGQGSQHVNMGKDLLCDLVFKKTMERCEAILKVKELLPVPLMELLYPTDESSAAMKLLLDETRYAQPAIFCLEFSAACMLQAQGVYPQYVLGHSLGEYVAAAVAKVLSLEDALWLVAERARLMSALPSRDGVMVACPAAVLDVERVLEKEPQLRQSISIAAINGPRNLVVSGNRAEVHSLLCKLDLIRCSKFLIVSHAFHSPLVSDVVLPVKHLVEKLALSPPETIYISTIIGKTSFSEVQSAAYWAHHITQPVCFMKAVECAVDLGARMFIEVGPKPTLIGMGKKCVRSEIGCSWLHVSNLSLNNSQSSEFLSKFNVQTHSWKHLVFPLHENFQSQRSSGDPLSNECSTLLPEIAEQIKMESDIRNKLKCMNSETLKNYVEDTVVKSLTKILDSPDQLPSFDTPLLDSGIDSLGALEFRSILQQQLGIDLPPTALFDYPTMNDLIQYIQYLLSGILGSPTVVPAPPIVNETSVVASLAVIGMSCRLPGSSNSPSSFWDMLIAQKDCVTDIPISRFNIDVMYDPNPAANKIYTRQGAFVDAVDMFDNKFFHIEYEDANDMDPQQRMLLELAFEAFNAAGFSTKTLSGTSTGVFCGVANNDWQLIALTEAHISEGHQNSLLGRKSLIELADSTRARRELGGLGMMIPNRISYHLGLTGPSFAIDTGCSSAHVAFDAAARHLRSNSCSTALVGAISLMLSPIPFVMFSRMRILSAVGKCKSFDSAADGLVRGEGGGAVILQPTVYAGADHKPILATLRGTAVGHYGRSPRITAPNPLSMQRVAAAMLRDAGVTPSSIKYYEAHGTGTPIGDVIEMHAIMNSFCNDRSHTDRLIVGAVHTNFGHTDATVALAAFIKTVLVLKNRCAPPNLHFQQWHPEIKGANQHATFSQSAVRLDTCEPGKELFGANIGYGLGGTVGGFIIEAGNLPVNTCSAGSEAEFIDPSVVWNKNKFLLKPSKHLAVLVDVTANNSIEPQKDVGRVVDYAESLMVQCNRDVGIVLPRSEQNVLLTCVSNFIGTVLLAKMLKKKGIPFLHVYCLVKAQSIEHARNEVRESLKSIGYLNTDFEHRVTLLLGEVQLPFLGLSDIDFQKLATIIDQVFFNPFFECITWNYNRLRVACVLSLENLIKLCSTSKLKPLHLISSFYHFPAFMAGFTNEFSETEIFENSDPNPDELEIFCPHTFGLPWCTWAAEKIISSVEKMGLPVSIYRLPNTCILFESEAVDVGNFNVALFRTVLAERTVPMTAICLNYGLAFSPADTACEIVVNLSMLPIKRHRRFNIVSSETSSTSSFFTWLERIGLYCVRVNCDEFFNVIERRGTKSPALEFLPLMRFWRRYWFTDEAEANRSRTFIHYKNVEDDLGKIHWPALEDVFRKLVITCLNVGIVSVDTLMVGVRNSSIAESTITTAQRVTGLDLETLQDICFYLEPLYIISRSVKLKQSWPLVDWSRAFHSAVRNLCNVKWMERRAWASPQIEQCEIFEPLFIIGLDPVGSSILQRFLAEDPSLRTPHLYEMLYPFGIDGAHTGGFSAANDASVDSRIQDSQFVLDLLSRLFGSSSSIGELVKAEMPFDDSLIFEHCGRSYSLSQQFDAPMYLRWLLVDGCAALKQSYPFHKRFLQHLQWPQKNVQWLINAAPHHLLVLDALFSAYPTARVVFIHRDPSDVLLSRCYQTEMFRSSELTALEKQCVAKKELEAINLITEKVHAFRCRHPDLALRFVDIQFHKLLLNPLKCIKKIYDRTGISLSPAAERKMHLLKLSYRKSSCNILNMGSLQDYGLDEFTVRETMSSYYSSAFLKRPNTVVKMMMNSIDTPKIIRRFLDFSGRHSDTAKECNLPANKIHRRSSLKFF